MMTESTATRILEAWTHLERIVTCELFPQQ